MTELINWCNENNGFLTGLLSLFTLFVSIIAVVISLHTARLPYIKKVKLESGLNLLVGQNKFTGEVASVVGGIYVNAINIGNRNVNIAFLGFAIKERNKKVQKMQPTERELGGKGILSPGEIVTAEYYIDEISGLRTFPNSTKIYCYAIDSEGKIYSKYYGKVGKLIMISKNYGIN